MKGTLIKNRFLQVLEIGLMLFVALFFMVNSIQAQGYRDFPYNYDDFYTFDSWFPSYAMNFQNNYGNVGQYGQGWGTTPFAFTGQTGGYLMPGNFGAFSSILQPWAFEQRSSSGSSFPSWLNDIPIDYTPINYSPAPSFENPGSPSFYAACYAVFYPGSPAYLYNTNGGRQGPYGPPPTINDSTPSNDPYHPNALWDLNWQLENTDVSLEEIEEGTSITIKQGKTLGLILANHRDIGIIWELDTDELDEDIIEKISDEQYPGYFTGPRFAAQPVFAREQWIFKAQGTGTTIIKMDLIDSTGKLETVTIALEVKVTN